MTRNLRWPTFVVLTVLVVAASAQAPAPLTQAFDDQVPGEKPRGWSVLWGDQGDDVLTISNLHSTSAANSVLLDRAVGDSPTMYGVGRSLPDAKNGWCVLSFAMRVEGDGSNVNLGIEVRRKDGNSAGKVLSLGLSGLKMKIGGAPPGDYRLGQWYRLTCWLPTAGGNQTSAHVALEARNPDGTWKSLGPQQTVAATPPPSGYGVLMFNTHPQKRNFRMFVDDFKVEQRDGPPS